MAESKIGEMVRLGQAPLILTGKVKKPEDLVNELWNFGLRERQKIEPNWTDSYLQYISKSETIHGGFSNFFLSLTFSQVRAVAPEIWNIHTAETPYVFFYPLSPNDVPKAQISEAVITSIMDDGEFPLELLHVLYLMLIYGDAFMKHTYAKIFRKFALPRLKTNPDTGETYLDHSDREEVELKVFDGIFYEARSPWRVVIDPTCYSPRPGRMNWAIDTEVAIPIERLMEMQSQGLLKNVEQIPENGWVDMFTRRLNIGELRDKNEIDGLYRGKAFLREYWGLDNRKIVIANNDIVLFDDYHDIVAGIPMTHFGLQNMPLEPYSFGYGKQLEYYQNFVNMVFGLYADELNLRVNTPVVRAPGVTFRSDFERIRPGMIIEGNPGDIQYLQRPNTQAEVLRIIDYIDQQAQRATGASLAAEGMVPTASETTATASSIAAQSTSKFIGFLAKLVGLSIGKMALHNNKTAIQLMAPREVRMISNDLQPQFQFITGSDLGVRLGFRVRDRAHSITRTERFNFLLGMYDRMFPLFAGQVDAKSGRVIPPILNPREVWLAILKESQIPEYPNFFTDSKGLETMTPDLRMMAHMYLAAQERYGGNVPGDGGQGGGSPQNPSNIIPRPQVEGGRIGNILGELAAKGSPAGNVPYGS